MLGAHTYNPSTQEGEAKCEFNASLRYTAKPSLKSKMEKETVAGKIFGRQQCLLHKHEDLSSNPWQSCKKARQVHVPVTLVLEWTGRNRQIQGVYSISLLKMAGLWFSGRLSQGNEANSNRRNSHIMCR